MTVPSGGTSDYAPEMLHAAAEGEPYACFVRPDTRIPFMAMPDGVDALLKLAQAPRDRLTRTVYNVGAFSPSAEEVRARVMAAFPSADITFQPHQKRQQIVDSWPADVDDSARPPRLGIRATLRRGASLRRVSRSHHPPALQDESAGLTKPRLLESG